MKTTRIIGPTLGQMAAFDIVLVMLWAGLTQWTSYSPGRAEVYLLAAVVLLHWIMLLVIGFQGWAFEVDSAFKTAALQVATQREESVDPWALQRDLMKASGQALPQAPVLNKGGLLYAALMMEELGETLSGVSHALEGGKSREEGEHSNLLLIRILINQHMEELEQGSKRLREILVEVPAFDYALSLNEAVEIFDGTTDVAVVNAGFALACGLPGADGYSEVVCSNLSKANPVTGVIDKTPDGKWIKGRDFFKPDLAKVLRNNVSYQDADVHALGAA